MTTAIRRLFLDYDIVHMGEVMISVICKSFTALCVVLFLAFSFAGCNKKPLGNLTVMMDGSLIENPSGKEVKTVENGSVSRGVVLSYFSEMEFNNKKYYEVETDSKVKGWIEYSLVEKGKIYFLTVLEDVYLSENPGDKNARNVANWNVKRGEYLTILDDKTYNGTKFYNVKIDFGSTRGWVSEKFVKTGILKVVTLNTHSDLYQRPSDKSNTAGFAGSGDKCLLLEENGDFALIQFPDKEGYVKKAILSKADSLTKISSLPDLGDVFVNSSSLLVSAEGGKMEFDPRNAFDGNLQTAWCEGKPNSLGKGEYIEIDFGVKMQITTIHIVNGYANNEETYNNYSRVAKLKISNEKGQHVEINLKDGVMDFQQCNNVNLTGFSFRFEINDAYKGNKFSDTCMSEIKIETIGANPDDPGLNEDG